MRRTDEAFKKEIYRRYYVQKRNQRNLRIFSATSLLLCVLAVGIILPSLAGISIIGTVADWFVSSPMKSYLDENIDEMRINISSASDPEVIIREKAQIQIVCDALKDLSLTVLDEPPFAYPADRISKFSASDIRVSFFTESDPIFAISFYEGYLILESSEKGAEPKFCSLPAEEHTALEQLLRDLHAGILQGSNHTREEHDLMLSSTLETYLEKEITQIQVGTTGTFTNTLTDSQQIEDFRNRLRKLELANCEDYSRSLAETYYSFDLKLADGTAMGVNVDYTGYIQLMPYHKNCTFGSHLYEFIIPVTQAGDLIYYATTLLQISNQSSTMISLSFDSHLNQPVEEVRLYKSTDPNPYSSSDETAIDDLIAEGKRLNLSNAAEDRNNAFYRF